jgi:hypothetical protein
MARLQSTYAYYFYRYFWYYAAVSTRGRVVTPPD